MTRRRSLAIALAVVALPARLPARESRAACLAAYNAQYESNWNLSNAAWSGQCEGGRESREIIRLHQASFAESCFRKFVEGARKVGLNEFDLSAYCARGAAGQAMLSTRTGVALETPAVSSAAASAAPPLKENAWTRIYALTRLKGNEFNRGMYGLLKWDVWALEGGGVKVYVPRHPGVEGNTSASQVCIVSTVCTARCEELPGYEPRGFRLEFTDIGCRGTRGSIRWGSPFGKESDSARAWLDAKMFERVGEKLEADMTWLYRNRR